jgi:hypothetical protein
MKRKTIFSCSAYVFLWAACLLGVSPAVGIAGTFVEDFSNTTKKDAANTTADWNVSAHWVKLPSTYSFAQQSQVNWDGAVTAVRYNGIDAWMIGGSSSTYGTRLNYYNGTSYTDLSARLPASLINNMYISCIEYGNGTWLIGGRGNKLISYNGTNFTDQSNNVANWTSGDICALKYGDTGGPNSFFLIAGQIGKLNKWTGGSFIDLSGKPGYFSNTTNAYSIGYNGSYWLIGGDGGNLSKYQASSSTFTDLGFQLRAAGYTGMVYAIGWDGTRWLLGGSSGQLFSYNGTTFTNLSGGIPNMVNVLTLQYNGSLWLIGGNGVGITPIIFSYNGSTFTQESTLLKGFTGNSWIYSLDYGNNQWLLGGGGLQQGENPAQGYLNSRASGSAAYTDQTANLRNFGTDNINAIAADANGHVLLGGGPSGGGMSAINSYTGSAFTNVVPPIHISTVNAIDGNGSTWLIGSYKLTSFNGTTWTDLSNQFGWTSTVNAIHWNTSECFVGSTNRQLMRYNGNSLSSLDISSAFGPSDSVNAIHFGDNTWVIGGASGSLAGYNPGSSVWSLNSTSASGFTAINAVGYAAYNGKHLFMIGGVTSPQRVRLWDADTKNWATTGAGWITLSGFTGNVLCLQYNPVFNYWLIGGENGKLNKYDWTTVTDLSSQLTGFYPTASIKSIAWNGEYWLLGGSMALLYKYFPTYTTPATAQSLNAATTSTWFGSATLNYNGNTVTGQTATFFMTADGTNWDVAVPGSSCNFSHPGQDLRWRASLSTNNSGASPVLNSITINYSEPTYTATMTPTITLTPTSSATTTITPTPIPNATGSATQTCSPTQTSTPTVSPTPTLFIPGAYFKILHSQINPLQNERARITWSQPQTGAVTIKIYNLLGDEIITVADRQSYDEGQFHELAWNGHSQNGNTVGSGIYIVDFQANNFKTRGKIAVVK